MMAEHNESVYFLRVVSAMRERDPEMTQEDTCPCVDEGTRPEPR